jgi:transcriptional regulator with XRE-family HTH domain
MIDLKRIRKDLKLTQKEIGDILGVPQSFVSDIENYKSNPPESFIQKLREHFKISIEKYLIEKDTANEARPIYKSEKNGDDVILHVPVMAEAGFTEGRTEAHNNYEMERYFLPGLPGGGYSFEVSGESMMSTLMPREILITYKKPIDRIENLKEGKIYVFVLRDCISIKRYGGFSEGHFLLLADNPKFDALRISSEDMLKVFEVRRILKYDLSKINM